MTQVGNCPRCGAPIYSEMVWQGLTPPLPVYSCNCRLVEIQIERQTCSHCYCQTEYSTTAILGHRRCCKCGDRVACASPYSLGEGTITPTPVLEITTISTSES